MSSLLFGHSECTLAKGRIKIPARFRKAFGADTFIIPSPTFSGLRLMSRIALQEMGTRVMSLPAPEPQRRAALRQIYAQARQTAISKAGMMRFPEEHIQSLFLNDGAVIQVVGSEATILRTDEWKAILQDPTGALARRLVRRVADSQSLGRAKTLKQYETNLADYISELNRMRELKDFRRLEELTAQIFACSGVEVVELSQYSKDGGWDVALRTHTGAASEVFYVQCKAGQKRVTVEELRQLIGTVGRDGVAGGILVATSGFTSAAVTEAHISKIQVTLVNAYRLAEWLRSFTL